MTIKLPLTLCGGYQDSVRDADNNLVLVGVNADLKEHQDFAALVVEAVNAHAHREDLIRKLITALALMRDTAAAGTWTSIQENALDLSREMGF